MAATLDMKGIAALAGRSVFTVSMWKHRYADFPAPVTASITPHNGGGRCPYHYLRDEIEGFLAAREKTLDNRVPHQLDLVAAQKFIRGVRP